jgi:hypothetical protein
VKATLAGLSLLFVAIPRRRVCFKRAHQTLGDGGHFVHSRLKHGFVYTGWTGSPTQFPNELERRRADFFVGRGRLEVRQRFDISAHG